ncbi:MAG: hypothetical protein OHK0017_05150 [Patescibacteria group bacterium]
MFIQLNANQQNYGVALIGFIIANLICLLFSGITEGDRPERSLIVNLFGYSWHIHHWMYGTVGLIICLFAEQIMGRSFWLSLFKGFNLGLAFHGLIYYNDYFDIINSPK